MILLPPRKYCPGSHLQEITEGKKRSLKRDDLTHVNFPASQECSKEKLFDVLQQSPEALSYCPSSWTKAERIDRSFTVAVLSTLYPKYMAEWGAYSRSKRRQLNEEQQQENREIKMTDDWIHLLAGAEWKPSKYRHSSPS